MRELYGPDHIVRAIKARIALGRASASGNCRDRLRLFWRAAECGACLPIEDYKATLRECYRLELKDDNDLSQISDQTVELVDEAARLGCSESANLRARTIEAGFHPKCRREDALRAFEYAANLGESTAFGRIGQIHERGQLTKRNDVAAYEAFDKQVTPLLLSKPQSFRAEEIGSDADRARWLMAGNALFEGKGIDATSVMDVWNLSVVYWKRAAALSDPFTAVIEVDDLKERDFDETAKKALCRLARAMYFGMGLRTNKPLALMIFWRTIGSDALSQEQLTRHFRVSRHRTDSISRLVKARLRRLGGGNAIRVLGETDSEGFGLRRQHEAASRSEGNKPNHVLEFLLGFFDLDEPAWIPPRAEDADSFSYPTKSLLLNTERLQAVRSLLLQAASTFDDMQEDANATAFAEALGKRSSEYVQDLVATLIKIGRKKERELNDFFSLRVLMAKLADEESVSLWSQDQRRYAIVSRHIWRELGIAEGYRNVAKALRKSTADFGPEPSGRDPLGFPILGRKKDDRDFIKRNRNPGWDRVHELKVDHSGFEVTRAARTEGKSYPLIFRRDIEVVLALAILEQNEFGDKAKVPSFSLENATDEPASQTTSLFAKKEFTPQWLSQTDYGKSLYHLDTMLFLDESLRQLVSVKTPIHSAAVAGIRMELPPVWSQAVNCGGVRASNSIRNAFIVRDRKSQHETARQTLAEQPESLGEQFHIPIPVELAHFDGSEICFDQAGKEENRDGGRHLLRYHAVRRAEVLTRGIHQVYESFPVFLRAAQLHGMYSTLREFFTAERRQALQGSELQKRLEKVRFSYASKADKRTPADRLVLLP